MKALDSTLILAKNRLYSTDAYVRLLLLDLDGSTTIRWAIYPEDVTYDGDLYTALPAYVEALTETNQGRIEGLRISVSNATRQVSAYLENSELLGRNVTVRLVHSTQLANAAAQINFTYRIDQVTITDEVAVFDLGRENIVAQRLPRNRYIRSRCRHKFKDVHCGYLSDEFGPSSKQDLADARTSGGPFEKLGGWFVDHADTATADIAFSVSGSLMLNLVGANRQWLNANHAGLFVYRELTGNFDIETYFTPTSISVVNAGVLFLATSADSANWVGFRWRCTTGPTQQLATISTASGTSTVTAVGSVHQYARIVRSGSTVTWYSKAAAADAWTQQATGTYVSLPTALRIGFAGTNDAAASTQAMYFDYLRFSSGGIDTCDQSFDGVNGCRAHKNTLRYGGAPAIPRGRIM